MEKSRHGAFVYAQKVLKHSLFLFLLINLLSISPDISASTTLLEQKYTLNLSFKDARLEQVLDAIMKQSGVKIAYSSDELQKDRVVSVDIQTSDILTALRSVLGDGYSFKQIEDYIAIARKETSEESDVINNSVIDDRIWTIQGQVLENSEPPYPLPGVNILIKGTSLGTISDGNGYFTIKAKRGDILIFKYLGFKDYEYVVSIFFRCDKKLVDQTDHIFVPVAARWNHRVECDTKFRFTGGRCSCNKDSWHFDFGYK